MPAGRYRPRRVGTTPTFHRSHPDGAVHGERAGQRPTGRPTTEP
ncbi:hypothetical protein Ae706Ps2_5710c [Pseudonocardia sp. Ae706_Ps2]|nr:hypothetical protein Ae706Ps2_5710c [Pseudonocardia sp. Ae706_Ps2]